MNGNVWKCETCNEKLNLDNLPDHVADDIMNSRKCPNCSSHN